MPTCSACPWRPPRRPAAPRPVPGFSSSPALRRPRWPPGFAAPWPVRVIPRRCPASAPFLLSHAADEGIPRRFRVPRPSGQRGPTAPMAVGAHSPFAYPSRSPPSWTARASSLSSLRGEWRSAGRHRRRQRRGAYRSLPPRDRLPGPGPPSDPRDDLTRSSEDLRQTEVGRAGIIPGPLPPRGRLRHPGPGPRSVPRDDPGAAGRPTSCTTSSWASTPGGGAAEGRRRARARAREARGF